MCRTGVPGDRAVYQQILSPTAHMHDVFESLFDTSRSSISSRLLYGLATRLSNLGTVQQGKISAVIFFI